MSWLSSPFRECGLEVRERSDTGPGVLVGRAEESRKVNVRLWRLEMENVLEDLEDLVNLGVTWEERFPCAHLCKDGSD